MRNGLLNVLGVVYAPDAHVLVYDNDASVTEDAELEFSFMHMSRPCPGLINGIPGQVYVGIRNVVQVDEHSKSVTIGFSKAEGAEKAYYHVVSGAGKSRAIRGFLGLTDAEMEQVADVIARGIRFEF